MPTIVASHTVPGLIVKTAKTKTSKGTRLVSRTFVSETGDKIVALMRMDGGEKESDHLFHEWMHTIERTLAHAEEPAYDRLEGALKELNGLLKGMQIGGKISEVDAIILVQDIDSVVHISQSGRAEAYLVRGSRTSQITERGTAKHSSQFLYISSGDLELGDSIIISTERLLRCLTPAQLAQAARRRSEALESIKDALEAEKDAAAVALCFLEDEEDMSATRTRKSISTKTRISALTGFMQKRRKTTAKGGKRSRKSAGLKLNLAGLSFGLLAKPISSFAGKLPSSTFAAAIRKHARKFLSDLQHPKRKRRAHLLLIAGALVVFIAIWSGFQVTVISRRSQSRSELQELVKKINSDITTAENRFLMGDAESANAILNRAEQEAKSVMQNESGLFRTDALDLLDQIREKRESISNIVRLSPSIIANLTSRNPNISARGLIGIERGRMIVYDRQNLYSIIVNAVDEPQRLDGDNLILNGSHFSRYNTNVFMTKENRLIELIDGQPTAMKTDDPAGWLSGPDIETYIRFLYILSPQNNQIYKYERLSNRYSEPTEYNVNGDLEDSIDMTIDANVYVLRKGGQVTKLFRGERRDFAVRNLPEGALKNATRIYKVRDGGRFYFLDPDGARIIVTSSDNDLGESLYIKQYVLESEQVGKLQDLYVDQEETYLIVLDEKRIYSINLQE